MALTLSYFSWVRERMGIATGKSAKDAGDDAAEALPAGPITGISAELRELFALRDAGILMAEEFAEITTAFLARHDERGFEARSARTSTTEPPVEVRAPASLETRGGAS